MSWITKKIVKKLLGEAGAGLDQSVFTENRLYDLIVALARGLQNRLINGGELSAPTTPSSQATGAGGITVFNVNVDAARVVVGNALASIAAAVDFSVHAATNLLPAVGDACVASLVAKNVSGTVSVVAVKGAVAPTATAAAPTDAQVQAAVGAGVPWVRLGNTKLARTADTVVAQTYDNTVADVGAELIVE